MAQTILVTGGAGYIGSHTVLQLLSGGYEVVILDNLERGYLEAVKRVEKLSGKKVEFHQADLRKVDEIREVFQKVTSPSRTRLLPNPSLEMRGVNAVVHFAAYKDMGEADKDPQKFYENNVLGTFNLLRVMREFAVNKIVFSSTSAVYGDAKELPITENSPVQPKNAYGHSKAAIEWMLEDYWNSFQLGSVRLRYFNAAGAHLSGEIGEDPTYCGNVLPMMMQTLAGKREKFLLFGNEFPTQDGTQERDYIHVMDLATAHVAALKKLNEKPGTYVYNLGTGKATSVKTLIDLTQKLAGKTLNTEVVAPRPGDALVVYCDPKKANEELQWQAIIEINQTVEDQWRWVTKNSEGYKV